MKPIRKKIFSLKKASGSSDTSKTMAESVVIDVATQGVNENTKTMASMMTQMNSTKSIMLIIIAGIIAYIFFKKAN